MKYSIVIVDDHLLIAKAISTIIEKIDGFEVLYETDNGKSMIDRFKATKALPDIVLLDISMPVMDGFETAKWIKENHPEIKIMALTMQGDDESLIKMIRNGAMGYLNKNIHPAELEKALNAIVTKGFYYPDWAASRLLHALANDKVPSVNNTITEREKEFLTFTCTELTYKEIAEKMICSPRTVESYRDSLFEKLGVKTRVALALYAVKSGLHSL